MSVHLSAAAGTLATPGLEAVAAAALEEVRRGREVAPERSIDVILADDELLADLNQRFRGRAGATDVISFPLDDASVAVGDACRAAAPIGEVYISLQRAREQAERYGASLAEEVARLVIHGALHLLGFDHIEAEDAARMKPLEEQYWRRWWALHQDEPGEGAERGRAARPSGERRS